MGCSYYNFLPHINSMIHFFVLFFCLNHKLSWTKHSIFSPQYFESFSTTSEIPKTPWIDCFQNSLNIADWNVLPNQFMVEMKEQYFKHCIVNQRLNKDSNFVLWVSYLLLNPQATWVLNLCGIWTYIWSWNKNKKEKIYVRD